MAQRQFQFSIILPVYNVEDYLAESLESVIHQTIGFRRHVQIILVNDGSPDNSGAICEQYQKKYPENIIYVEQKNAGVSTARNTGLAKATGKYVNFLDSDDKWEPSALKKVWAFFEAHADEIDVVSTRMIHFEASTKPHILNKKFKAGDRIVDVTKRENAACVQMHVTSAFFKREALEQSGLYFDPKVRYGEDSLFVNSAILERGRYGLLSSCIHFYRKRSNQTSAVQTQNTNLSYYTDSPRRHYYGLMNLSKAKYGRVLPYIQNVLAYDVGWRFYSPVPPVIRADAALFEQYETMLKDVLDVIEDRYIITNEIHPHFERKNAMYRMKHGKGIYRSLQFSKKDKCFLCDGIPLLNLGENSHAFRIMSLEIKKNTLYLQGLTYRWIFRCFPKKEKALALKIGGKTVPLELLPYKHDKERSYFGERQKSYLFKTKVRLTDDLFDENGKLRLRLVFSIGKRRCSVALGYSRLLPSRRTNPKAYQILGSYCVTCGKDKIVIEKPKNLRKLHWQNEKKMLGYLLKKHQWGYFLLRLRVMLLRVLLGGKKVWLLSDRAENAGDNGEVFFKYLVQHTPKDVKPIFTISKTAACAKRLQQEGKVIFLESRRYRTWFLLADKVISSSANEFTLNPFDEDARYVRDLFRYRFYYLQHGVACADLSAWLNKFNKNIHMICTSSRREQRAFQRDDYYYTKAALPITGQARFDELTDAKEKLILILPTWRKAIRESYDVNTTSVYFDGFKETAYFKYYNALINNERLLSVMRENGYKGLFCIHPIHMKQARDFTANDVFSVNEGYVNYNDVFARAAMMVTDYSSVLFDFAYLKKRVLYTQFDKKQFFEEQTYDMGYFKYERDGFGPVCYDYESTVDAMIEAVREDCANPAFYQERVDRFFCYQDQNNCKRILEAILARDA